MDLRPVSGTAGTEGDRNAALFSVGAVLAIAVGRLLVVVLIALVRAVVLAAAVGTVLWLGYQAVQGTDSAAGTPAPAVRPVEVAPIGPLATK